MSTFYGLGSGEETSFNLINKIENQADHVMRFAYCLTLNMSDSEDLCQQVFKAGVQKGLGFWSGDSRDLRVKLFQITWEKFNEKSYTEDSTVLTITAAIKSMDVKSRATLVLVDALGVDVETTFTLLGMNEAEGRNALSETRKQLVNFKF